VGSTELRFGEGSVLVRLVTFNGHIEFGPLWGRKIREIFRVEGHGVRVME
jgi:hypothetical protein